MIGVVGCEVPFSGRLGFDTCGGVVHTDPSMPVAFLINSIGLTLYLLIRSIFKPASTHSKNE